MEPDLTSIENDLKSLRPAALDAAFIARFEACVNETIGELDPSEREFERELMERSPAPLSPELMASLTAIVSAVPYPTPAPNIVAFPIHGELTATLSRSPRHWWGAAAAVALFGAFAGLMVPGGKPTQPIASSQPSAPLSRPAAPSALVPAGFNRGLSEASDEGVILQSEDKAHRVLKMVYQDRVTLKDVSGRTYQIEQPRTEYILVPSNID